MQPAIPRKRLRKQTITQRLTLLLATVASGFALVAIAYWGFITVNNAAIETSTANPGLSSRLRMLGGRSFMRRLPAQLYGGVSRWSNATCVDSACTLSVLQAPSTDP